MKTHISMLLSISNIFHFHLTVFVCGYFDTPPSEVSFAFRCLLLFNQSHRPDRCIWKYMLMGKLGKGYLNR